MFLSIIQLTKIDQQKKVFGDLSPSMSPVCIIHLWCVLWYFLDLSEIKQLFLFKKMIKYLNNSVQEIK
jgi:hypothetical protein